MKKIVIFEDSEEEQQKAIKAAHNLGLEPIVESTVKQFVMIIGDSQEEMQKIQEHSSSLIDKSKVVGVVTDLYMPYSPYKQDNESLKVADQPVGLVVYWKAISRGLHAIICSNESGHGGKSEWIKTISNDVFSSFGLTPVIVKKDWDFAMRAVSDPSNSTYRVISKFISRYQEILKTFDPERYYNFFGKK